MNLDPNDLKILADEVLTFIEKREAEQVAYGMYDVTMTGVEVIDNFQPSEEIKLTLENKTEAIRNALAQLTTKLAKPAIKLTKKLKALRCR